MSWLSEKMKAKTIRDFAGVLLARKDWPKSVRLTQDSLRNRLHDADARKNTGWWLKGKGMPALHPLAKALGVSVDELNRLLQQPASQRETGARIEIDSFEGVFIDPEKDDSFLPGFPSELVVNDGRHLDCAWWTTSDTIAVGWVSQWLEKRFDWHVRRMEKWDGKSLPSSGKVFVELAGTDGLPADWVSTVPIETHVCIACRLPPPPPAADKESPQAHPIAKGASTTPITPPRRVTTLTPPPPREWIDALISWLAPRVPPGGRFKARTAARLTHGEYDGMDFAEPREVLSFLELVDDHDETVFGGDRSRLIREWVSNAETRAVPDGHAVAKCGDEILLALNTARLREVLPSKLTAEQWRALLPRDFLPERIRNEIESRARTGGAASTSKLWKLLDPQSVDWVGNLLRCEVLRPSADGLISIHSPLLARFVDEISFKRLWESPAGLGTLMLNNTTSAQAISLLLGDFLAGNFVRAENWLTKTDHSAESLATCDGIFRAIGIALTVPSARVPLSLIRQAWKTYTLFSEELYAFSPRIPFVTIGVSSNEHGFNSEGAHHLAASAISLHLLRAGDAIEPSALLPSSALLGARPLSSQYWESARRAFSLIARAFENMPPTSNERLAPYRLAEQLLLQFGRTDIFELDHLQQPAAIALYGANGSAEQSLGRVGAIDLAATIDACSRHGVTVERALEKAWHVWLRTGFNYVMRPLSDDVAKTVFSALTREHIDACNRWEQERLPHDTDRRLSLRELQERSEIWPHLRPEIWEYWVETGFISSKMLPYFPESAVRQILRQPGYWLNSNSYIQPGALWASFPDVVFEFIHAVVIGSETEMYWPALAYAAPANRVRELVERLNGHEDRLVHEWLVVVVEKRQPGWREAARHLLNYAASCANSPEPALA